MRAVFIDDYGGVDTLRVGTAPVPTPTADEVLVKVAYAGRLTEALFARLDQVQISVAGDFRTPAFGGVTLPASPRVVAAVPRFLIAFAAVARCDAVVIAPRRLALRHAADFGLRAYELPFALPPIQVLAVRRSHPDAGVRFLVDELERALADTEG